jgi:hypothetical protein
MGSRVNAETGAYLLIIVIPLTVVWVIALVDIVRQEHMSTRAKWTWAILCSVIWPVLIVYLLTRPVQGRFERSESRDYTHGSLTRSSPMRTAGSAMTSSTGWCVSFARDGWCPLAR